jgi:phosphotransferase system HPr-like phosphotransfer protein
LTEGELVNRKGPTNHSENSWGEARKQYPEGFSVELQEKGFNSYHDSFDIQEIEDLVGKISIHDDRISLVSEIPEEKYERKEKGVDDAIKKVKDSTNLFEQNLGELNRENIQECNENTDKQHYDENSFDSLSSFGSQDSSIEEFLEIDKTLEEFSKYDLVRLEKRKQLIQKKAAEAEKLLGLKMQYDRTNAELEKEKARILRLLNAHLAESILSKSFQNFEENQELDSLIDESIAESLQISAKSSVQDYKEENESAESYISDYEEDISSISDTFAKPTTSIPGEKALNNVKPISETSAIQKMGIQVKQGSKVEHSAFGNDITEQIKNLTEKLRKGKNSELECNIKLTKANLRKLISQTIALNEERDSKKEMALKAEFTIWEIKKNEIVANIKVFFV